MLNDRSTPLALLETRRSARARDMVGPGPSPEQLGRIIAVAARTPDHGKLAPWRFVIVEDDQREALAALLHRALEQNDPEAGPAHHAKADQFARQGEALVVLLSAPVRGHKVPIDEQEMSAGAVGMNLLHAANALGFVGSWLTGWAAYDPTVREAFAQGPDERIIGFFFFGSPGQPLQERPRPLLSRIVRQWSPTEA
ncbi:nitroreductase [Sphingomonas sp. BN140010]|uniref:Putative NAD(P)H nitroreductase n=1 Tax=Sphingomonas arvum TaxID=2992113 RepID=A0ABT3JFH5_9SPHN|nr:nitroreductase [Sphingomonas sp. BN140010]MCW3797561.1 nitroreductase [Sphingomonas sp. BN140010]